MPIHQRRSRHPGPRSHAGITHHCLFGLQRHPWQACHKEDTPCFFGAIGGSGPITTLIPRWTRLLLAGSRHNEVPCSFTVALRG